MKINWIITSMIAGVVAIIITYLLIMDWKISLISGIIVFILVLINNPVRRYMSAFYVVLFPLISNFYFNFGLKGEDLNIEVGLDKMAIVAKIILGVIAVVCLILDFFQRNGKLEGTVFSVKKNTAGNIKGNNNQINQTNV